MIKQKIIIISKVKKNYTSFEGLKKDSDKVATYKRTELAMEEYGHLEVKQDAIDEAILNTTSLNFLPLKYTTL